MDFLRKYQVHILAGLLAFFLIYIALGFGSSFFAKGSPNDTAIEVDGTKISLRKFLTHYQRSLDQTRSLDAAGRQQKRDETIRDLVQAVVFKRESDRYGIKVPDEQVAISLTQVPAFQNQGQFNRQLYMQVLQTQLKMTPQEFGEEQRAAIAFFKLRWLIQSSVKVTDQEMAWAGHFAEFAKVNAVETTDTHDEKTGKVTGHKTRRRGDAELRDLFRRRLWEEKISFVFNQWYTQLGQKLRVKPHADVLESVAK